MESIVEFHRDTAGIEVLVLPGLQVSPLDVDMETLQVPGRVLFEQAQRTYFPGDYHPSTYIVIAPFDLSSNGGGWYFGARFGWRLGGHQHGVFSYFRMANVAPYDGSNLDDALLMERVNKYTGRYTALLYLGHELQWDRDFLNYAEMYGFSDLDSMGAAWPTWEAPCRTNEPVICIVPDGIYESQAFESDLAVAVRRLNRDLPVQVHMRTDVGGYVPTWDPWSEEFAIDLHGSHRDFIFDRAVTVIGVTDDPFRDVPSGSLHMERYDPAGIGVVSAYGAGDAGSREHQERLYRLLLRAIAVQHFGVELSVDSSSLHWIGATSPSQLDRLNVEIELPFE